MENNQDSSRPTKKPKTKGTNVSSTSNPNWIDPDHTLYPGSKLTTTVHWDPTCRDGSKIGWKVQVLSSGSWHEGRIVRYDPYTHKHKIDFGSTSIWIWLRSTQHELRVATRVVWAHVKGYAWWPALVMEEPLTVSVGKHDPGRNSSVFVEFFGSGEVANLRESVIRAFSPDVVDPVVAKHKKKRNARAFELACQECREIQRTRNQAALFYAQQAFDHVDRAGQRIRLHRLDINYPYGETVTARVKVFNGTKHLLRYDDARYDPSWIQLDGKECHSVVVLEHRKEMEDIVPYIIGYDCKNDDNHELVSLLTGCCRGCVMSLTKHRVRCDTCLAEYHLGCWDPPLGLEAWQRMKHFRCTRCIACHGCVMKDIAFGCHPLQNRPPTLSFPRHEALLLCSTCTKSYDAGNFCPNCAHVWDSDKLEKVTTYMELSSKKRRIAVVADSSTALVVGSFKGEDILPPCAKVDPKMFYPETSEWGYGENEMLVCDSCHLWVHAGCAGIDENEYDLISKGRHPHYSSEFLCRACCRRRCKEIIEQLQALDRSMVFALPVSDKVAPNYRDVIKHPMDLQTMSGKAEREEYLNYAWVRDCFELMVLNALTFNRFGTPVWNEARRYYLEAVKKIFSTTAKAAPPGRYRSLIEKNFEAAEELRKSEAQRIQIDESVEKKDLVAGSDAAPITLPKLRECPPDQSSCLPCTESKLKTTDAFYTSWMDCCYTCGSCGAMDTMIFCVDCGEAFHSFCVSAPVHSMDEYAVAAWRCPNCKICEISGDVPPDETRMLFCEMCDRAFSLDLLDPPLESAPPGVWVCGQCIFCETCNNTSERDGPTRKHWSRNPKKCYRCGGCEGLVEEYTTKMQCVVCSTLLRTSDSGIVKCSMCEKSVHAKCDPLADESFVQSFVSRAAQGKPSSYVCPSCAPLQVDACGDPVLERSFFSHQAWALINNGHLLPDESCSAEEIHSKLMDAVDWEVRALWVDEYKVILLEGLRLFQEAKAARTDPRIVVQYASSGSTCLPPWTIQRALRFVLIVRRAKWDECGMNSQRIDVIVHSAKLAASFIKVASAVMHKEIDKTAKESNRFARLLSEPSDECGIVALPIEAPRGNEHMACAVLATFQRKPETPPKRKAEREQTIDLKLALPLCGWNVDATVVGLSAWRDPRECCLCHLCGDDDAGFEQVENLCDLHLGRLLPMPSGCFVHVGCALWSSETWEDTDEGQIHAVERARVRGSQLKCFGCGRHGATVGCNKSNCVLNYHLPCARACEAVFSSNQHMYCANHASAATDVSPRQTSEYMRALLVSPEKKDTGDPGEEIEMGLCSRVGALIVHSIGEIHVNRDGFHNESYIMPPGYVATRIFWSFLSPRKRTVYVLKIETASDGSPVFTILPGDDPSQKIRAKTVSQAYATLMDRVRWVNSELFSVDNLHSKLPVIRRTRRKAHGLNGPQFFGFGVNFVRRKLESAPGVEAVVAPLGSSSPRYRFCFIQPSIELIQDLQRKRAAAKAEMALENSSGCARTEGMKAVARSGGSGRITRALVRNAEEDTVEVAAATTKKGAEKAKADKNLTQVKYRRMKSIPIEERLVTRRSHIHGWGLFTKLVLEKDHPIVEYMGEVIRQPIADKRERAYEVSGEGSCYMFRLDVNRIVDATMTGCMARFINHSCDPNAYAKIISVDSELGQERKIVIFANRKIAAGAEVTYDYKFPVEDGSLRCRCGALNCIGRLN